VRSALRAIIEIVPVRVPNSWEVYRAEESLTDPRAATTRHWGFFIALFLVIAAAVSGIALGGSLPGAAGRPRAVGPAAHRRRDR
jgi:hypothetical protein